MIWKDKSTKFSGKGLKFQPIRSEKTVRSRFRLVEICDPSPKISYFIAN